jgi:hypothetical protein
LDPARWNQIPRFQRDEIMTGRVVGRGGFGVVRDVSSIQLLVTNSGSGVAGAASSTTWNTSSTTGGGGGLASEGTTTTTSTTATTTPTTPTTTTHHSTGSSSSIPGGSFGIIGNLSGHGGSSSTGRTGLRLFRQTSKDSDLFNTDDRSVTTRSGDRFAPANNASSNPDIPATTTREQLARRVWSNKKKKDGKYVLKEVECALLVSPDGGSGVAGVGVVHSQAVAADAHNLKAYRKGTMDLALEARFLASLSHPFILQLRGLAASADPDNNNSSDVTTGISASPGYFIILDKLQETLPKRLNAWMHRDRACKGITGALTAIGSAGKNRRKELLMDRILVAHDIASAMCYLHGKNIIYVRYLCWSCLFVSLRC